MQRRSSIAPILALRAAQHRALLTPSEQALWAHLRGGRLGVWFRRQVPIGRYIVDFLAPTVRLIVEVDGGYHRQRRALDARRDQQLARLGYRVLRIEAEQVQRAPESAVALIRASLVSESVRS